MTTKEPYPTSLYIENSEGGYDEWGGPDLVAAYSDAIEALHAHDLKRPDYLNFKGPSLASAVDDWRIGYETIANQILGRAKRFFFCNLMRLLSVTMIASH